MPVDGPPTGEDPSGTGTEELRTPERSRWLGGWVLAVLIVGVAVWALARPSPSPSASRTPSPSTSSSARPVVEPALSVAPTVDSECDGLAGCAVRAGVPPSLAQLARAYLPSGVRLQVRTVLAPGSLTSNDQFIAREVDAHINSVTVLIRVQRGGSRTQAIAPDPLGFGSLLLHHVNAGFVVRLQYLAPETVPPMLGRLRALMRDPRLIAS